MIFRFHRKTGKRSGIRGLKRNFQEHIIFKIMVLRVPNNSTSCKIEEKSNITIKQLYENIIVVFVTIKSVV